MVLKFCCVGRFGGKCIGFCCFCVARVVALVCVWLAVAQSIPVIWARLWTWYVGLSVVWASVCCGLK